MNHDFRTELIKEAFDGLLASQIEVCAPGHTDPGAAMLAQSFDDMRAKKASPTRNKDALCVQIS